MAHEMHAHCFKHICFEYVYYILVDISGQLTVGTGEVFVFFYQLVLLYFHLSFLELPSSRMTLLLASDSVIVEAGEHTHQPVPCPCCFWSEK